MDGIDISLCFSLMISVEGTLVYKGESLAGSHTGITIIVAVGSCQFVHHFGIVKKYISIAHLHRVDTCAVLCSSHKVLAKPSVAHLTCIPLADIYTERRVAKNSFLGERPILCYLHVRACDVATQVVVIV